MRDMHIEADAYLAAHPELIEEANARAWCIAVNDPRSQIGRALIERRRRAERKS
jgi:hypothetical protein